MKVLSWIQKHTGLRQHLSSWPPQKTTKTVVFMPTPTPNLAGSLRVSGAPGRLHHTLRSDTQVLHRGRRPVQRHAAAHLRLGGRTPVAGGRKGPKPEEHVK